MSEQDIDRRSDGTELRYYGTQLDEIVAHNVKYLHLEQMSDGLWWMGIDLGNGEHIAVTLSSRTGRASVIADANVMTLEEQQ